MWGECDVLNLPTQIGQSHSSCPRMTLMQSRGGQWWVIATTPAWQVAVLLGAGQCFSPSLNVTPFSR